MHRFLILSIIAVATAAPQGYNYQQQVQVSAPAPVSASAPVQQYQHTAAVGPAPVQQYNPGPSVGVAATQQNYQVASGNVQQYQHGAVGTPAPIVSKHYYVHSAPEETAEEAKSEQLAAGPSHKHYRVVFIKAPSQSASAAAISLAQAQNEEKTIIYVLTKKTDAAELQANLQTAHQTPSKPEVFFIKYKTPEEAEHAQHQIQAQYDALGGTSQVSDEGIAPVQSFIGALGDAGQGLDNAASAAVGQAVEGNIAATNAYLPPTY